MADYYINPPFCSNDFIRSYVNHQKLEKQVFDLNIYLAESVSYIIIKFSKKDK